ncbi:hypothetical protein HYU14_03595 [Candidatus Woesearchaeota archaeon]|nr:hypothetical protein [Candidatus Woesearchaeota archaeon]
MDDTMGLLHIRIGKHLKQEMQNLIESGLFTNQAEIVREGVRDLLIKYQTSLRKRP